MDVIELIQVAGPILLGVAGMLSGWGIARHQSQRAVEAEARQRLYDASSKLLGASVQAENLLAVGHYDLWESSGVALADVAAVRAQAEAALADCELLAGGRLAPLATDVVLQVRQATMYAASPSNDNERLRVESEGLLHSQTKFAKAARFELGADKKESRKRRNEHERHATMVANTQLPNMHRWWEGDKEPAGWDGGDGQSDNHPAKQKSTPTSGEGAS